MRAVRLVVGRAVPLDRANIDTDQIIPSDHLKRIDRAGYGAALFEGWRRDPEFVLNDPRHRGATVLLAGPNFGCGSSREHAAWALLDAGFDAVIAPSFADIFRANALRNGLVAAATAAEHVRTLLDLSRAEPSTLVEVDVDARRVRAPSIGLDVAFALEDAARRRLLEGLDDIALTLAHEREIASYEARRAAWLPRVRPP